MTRLFSVDFKDFHLISFGTLLCMSFNILMLLTLTIGSKGMWFVA